MKCATWTVAPEGKGAVQYRARTHKEEHPKLDGAQF
jgi:hypothetical protein